jgi:predicted DNA-binding transcriptional regulator YafY
MKRLLTASELANKFSVSNRTIYQDIKALEKAGVPIFTEEGKGYISLLTIAALICFELT